MIERHAIEDRGRAMGLTPRGGKVSLSGPVQRAWQTVPAEHAAPGDMWAEHGVVDSVQLMSDRVVIWAGIPATPYVLELRERIRLYARRETRW